MNHHRCTSCKQESYPRHKWKGGVYCDSCIEEARGYGRHGKVRSWFGGIWDKIVEFVDRRILQRKVIELTVEAKERQVISRMKQIERRARSIPFNPQALSPQKR